VRRRKVNVFSDAELLELLGHDPELLAIADAIAETQAQPSASRSQRRHLLLAAAIVAAGVLLVALPALAVFTSLIDFSSAPPAPVVVVKRFDDLQRQAPPNMDPRVIANEARRLDLTTIRKPIALFLAPTRTGGYCFELAGYASGCNADRTIPVAVGLAAQSLTDDQAIVYGSTLDPAAVSATVSTREGGELTVPLTRVTAPIDASFFVTRIGRPDEALPLRVEIRDGSDRVIATHQVGSPPPP
jgi:hypothetical protein